MIKNIIRNTREYFLYFIFYSVFGWLYEVFLEVVVYRWGYSDRGVLTGPYCPVYGFGALIFIIVFYDKIRKKTRGEKLKLIPAVFAGCSIFATLLELAASYICEYFTGAWPWQTYVDYSINFQGRVALSPSIRFGIGGIIFLYIIQPSIEKAYNKIGCTFKDALFFVVFTLFVTDFVRLLLFL